MSQCVYVFKNSMHAVPSDQDQHSQDFVKVLDTRGLSGYVPTACLRVKETSKPAEVLPPAPKPQEQVIPLPEPKEYPKETLPGCRQFNEC